jgi:hypothetical protein
MSYNVNKANKNSVFSVSSIFAQQSSGKSRLCENSSFKIPSSSWNQTPTRRSCQGIDDSYLFDLRYAIQTNETPQPISVWIEYDVTFHTPQIETLSSTPTIGNQFSVLKFGAGENIGKPEGTFISGTQYYWNVEGHFNNIYIEANNISPAKLVDIYGTTSHDLAKLNITYSNGSVKSFTIGYNHGSDTAASNDNNIFFRADDAEEPTDWYQWNSATSTLTALSWYDQIFITVSGLTQFNGDAVQIRSPIGITKVEVDYSPVLAKQNFVIIPY